MTTERSPPNVTKRLKPQALIVEDDAQIAYLLQFILSRDGFSVAMLQDGRAAREAIAVGPAPALVTLDIMLPYVDGLELVRDIRSQRGWEGVPIIMLTAKSHESDIVRALDAGANDYVVKPFQPEELRARVRRLTGNRQ
jgi:DNA-binding response OmpR family regulator